VTRFDDVALDLTGIPSGLVAVTGPHGEGKTTLLDALGPAALYRRLSTRAGPLKDWCTRRDACLDLEVEHAGSHWRCLVAIDPSAKGGVGIERATLYRDGVALTGGNVTDYDVAIGEHFPTRALFLASAFGAQDRGGSFLSLDVPARKRLFVSMLGLGGLQGIADRAGDERKRLDLVLVDVSREREASTRDDT
jgi:exonuclease SbcC